jgi:hypothetical protein
MKTIFLTLFFFFNFLSFSQKLIIHVFEKQEMVCERKTTLDSVYSSPDYTYDIDSTYTRYVLDLDEKTSTYFVNDVEKSVLPIEYEDFGDDVLKVSIIEGDFDYGLLVNTKDESVMWFWFTDYMTTVKKISKCRFEKAS